MPTVGSGGGGGAGGGAGSGAGGFGDEAKEPSVLAAGGAASSLWPYLGVATARHSHDEHEGHWWTCNQRTIKCAYIMTIGVQDEYRHQGIGSKLLQHLLRQLLAYGCTRIDLHCTADNSHAVQMYQMHGFRMKERLQHYYFFDDKYHDAFRLCLVVPKSYHLDPASSARSLLSRVACCGGCGEGKARRRRKPSKHVDEDGEEAGCLGRLLDFGESVGLPVDGSMVQGGRGGRRKRAGQGGAGGQGGQHGSEGAVHASRGAGDAVEPV